MEKTTFNFKTFLFYALFSMLSITSVFSQSDYYSVISGGSTSGNGRAPQGSRTVSRSVWLLTAAEMAAAGYVSGDVVSGIGFTFQTGQDVTTTGNIVFYLENTADATNTKSTTWSTAITGMTTVSNGSITIPNAAGDFNYLFSGGNAFTYNGGALYVAFDYQNLTNPVSTVANIAYCNTNLTGGLKGAISAAGSTTPPATVATSNFRPETRLAKSVSCARPIGLGVSVSGNIATLTWNAVGGSNVDVEFGSYGFTPGSGTTYTNVSSPYVIPVSLLENSVYDFYVRTNCGTSYSLRNGPLAFTGTWTPATPTYNTGFEQEELPFIGWSTPNAVPVAGDWVLGNYGPGVLVQEGNYSATSVTPAAAAANNSMFSRGINLTAGNNVTITMYMSNFQGTGVTATGNYEVTVGTSPTTAAQTTVLGGETALSGAAFTLKTFSFTPSSSGIYYFGIKNSTAAVATGTHAILIDNFTVTETLSNAEFLASNISVFPNPVKDILSINANNLIIENVKIVDVNGRIIVNKEVNLSEIQINMNSFNSGIYFVNILTKEGFLTKKFIKN